MRRIGGERVGDVARKGLAGLWAASRDHWRALPLGWRWAILALLVWLALAPAAKWTLWWWDLWFNQGATFERLAPKR